MRKFLTFLIALGAVAVVSLSALDSCAEEEATAA
jgi:hypothetical protein